MSNILYEINCRGNFSGQDPDSSMGNHVANWRNGLLRPLLCLRVRAQQAHGRVEHLEGQHRQGSAQEEHNHNDWSSLLFRYHFNQNILPE